MMVGYSLKNVAQVILALPGQCIMYYEKHRWQSQPHTRAVGYTEQLITRATMNKMI